MSCREATLSKLTLALILLLAAPALAQETTASLHDSRFGIAGGAIRGDEDIDGLVADWDSPLGVLFYFFSPNNPEMMVKVLDTRRINDHWNLYLGSLSDLPTVFIVTTRDLRDQDTWSVLIGPQNRILANVRGGRRVYCASPLSRILSGDGRCSILEFGQSAIIKFAWDQRLRIPNEYRSNYSQLDGMWSLPLPEETIERVAASQAVKALRDRFPEPQP